MKKIFLVILIISAVTARAQTSMIQPIDATDCSNIFFRALLEEDGNTLNNLLSSDFSVTGLQGQMIDRNFLQNAISQGYLKIETGMLSGTLTRDYGNVGVVTGTWSTKGQLQNNSFQNDLAYMVVCVKSGGSWKVTAVQFTPVR